MPTVALGSRTDGGRCADHCSLPSSVMWRSVVWNSLANELREVVWLIAMIGALSVVSVVAGVALTLSL